MKHIYKSSMEYYLAKYVHILHPAMHSFICSSIPYNIFFYNFLHIIYKLWLAFMQECIAKGVCLGERLKK